MSCGLLCKKNHISIVYLQGAILIEVRAQSLLGNAFVHGKTGIWTPPKIFKKKAKTQCRGWRGGRQWKFGGEK